MSAVIIEFPKAKRPETKLYDLFEGIVEELQKQGYRAGEPAADIAKTAYDEHVLLYGEGL